MEEANKRRQFRCIRSPMGPMGGTLLKRRAIYVIYESRPDKLTFLTVNGSLGRSYDLSEVPKPFEKYFQELP